MLKVKRYLSPNRSVSFAIALAALVILAMACGSSKSSSSGSSAVLHFTGRDETEANFRTRLRQVYGSNPAGVTIICHQVKGLSAKDAVQFVVTSNTTDPSTIAGATPRAGQVATQADLEKATAIYQDECIKMGL